MAQENCKSLGRYTTNHEHHHKEDPKITTEDSWNERNEDDHEEACLMAVESQKAHQNHRSQVDSWNVYIINNKVALQSSIVIKPYTYHYNDIGKGKSPLSFGRTAY
ncbi:hypothetical protein Tco_1086777 [Tanacetum coccineum]